MNCVLYSAFLPKLSDKKHSNQQIFSQLYYSLKTLKDRGYTEDIFIFYDSDVDLKNFSYKEKYSLKEFKNLNYIKFEYDEKIRKTTKCAFHKWFALKLFNDNFNFNRVLYVDNDTVFGENPKIIFEENNDLNSFYGSQYYFKDDIIKEKLEMQSQCLNTGQFLVSKEVIKNLGDNFLEDVIKNYFLVLKITNEFKKELFAHMIWVGEEYAVTKTIEKKVKIVNLNERYAVFSKLCEKSVLSHYYSSNTKKVIPKEYWSEYTATRGFTGYSCLSDKKIEITELDFSPKLSFYKFT